MHAQCEADGTQVLVHYYNFSKVARFVRLPAVI